MANYSRQQGKTTVVTLLCLEWLLTPNEDVIYFTPKKNLGKTIYGKLIKLLPEKLVTKSNGTDLFIETVMGSSLKFFSGESAQSARRKQLHKINY